MPRKYKSTSTYLQGDPRYNDRLVAKFVNCMMYDGKKTTAYRAFYGALDAIAKKVTEAEPIEVFHQAIENLKPKVETRSKRVGGATYQVPVDVRTNRKLALAIRWLLQTVRGKRGSPLFQRLANEIVAAFRKEGDAIKKRLETHKMAESNQLFSHFSTW
jgi:small subunit ribosomal protein S7